MGLEDRARERIAARNAKAAQHEKALVQWQTRQLTRVQQILSEFIKLVRDYDVAPLTLFYVVPIMKKTLFGKKGQLEFGFGPVAQVWKIGKASAGAFEILTVTENLQVISAIRIQKAPGEYILAIDNRCARTFPPYSVPQWLDGIQPEDFQRAELDAFVVNPIALATNPSDAFMMASGIFSKEPPWIEQVVECAAVAIINSNTRR